MQDRPFEDPDDLRRVQRFAQEVWRLAPMTVDHTTVGELAWAMRQHLGREAEWRRRVWLDDDVMVGWGWVTPPGTLEWQVHPRHPALVDDVLDWFEEGVDSIRRTSIRSVNEAALEALHDRGYMHDPDAPWFLLNIRELDDLEEARLPDGFELLTMAELNDVEARVAVHRAAWEPSRVTVESYRNVMQTWPYRPDLDCVVRGPDGSLVASALGWIDEENAIGELEPVGTHPDYRQQGFAKAVNLFALRQLRDAGATQGIVACRGDADYPIPKKLYQSLGFSEFSRQLQFVQRPGV